MSTQKTNAAALQLFSFGLAAAQFGLERQRIIAEEVARRVPANATPEQVRKVLEQISAEALAAARAEIEAQLSRTVT